MTREPNPYDSPHEPSQATRPPKPKRWKLWVSLGLLVGAIAMGLGVHYYISMTRMSLIRYRLPEPEVPSTLEGTADERSSESL